MRRACSLWGWVWLAGTMGSAFGGSAAEVLDRAVGAHGGAWALARLADVTLEGRITYPSRGLQELVLRAEIRAPDRVRTEVTGPGVTRLYVTDGTYAWVVEKGSKRALTVRDVAGRFCELNPPVGFLAAARDGRLHGAGGRESRRRTRSAHKVTTVFPRGPRLVLLTTGPLSLPPPAVRSNRYSTRGEV